LGREKRKIISHYVILRKYRQWWSQKEKVARQRWIPNKERKDRWVVLRIFSWTTHTTKK
jgi:hypothetical protein